MDNSAIKIINASLNVVLTLVIIAFFYMLYIQYIVYSAFEPSAPVINNETGLKIKIQRNVDKSTDEETDYNHIRQRKVRRELADGQRNTEEFRRKIEDRHKQKVAERQQTLSKIADKEFIISLDSTVNKFIAELTNLKQRGVLVCKEGNVSKKIEEVEKITANLEKNIDRVDRGYQKIILLREYKDKLSRC